jgi:hypothetical protein
MQAIIIKPKWTGALALVLTSLAAAQPAAYLEGDGPEVLLVEHTGSFGTAVNAVGKETGVMAQGTDADWYSIGVDAQAYGGDEANWGILARAYGTNGIGVYAQAYDYGSYAGYFDGDVMVTGYLDNPSDARFKKNVRPLAGGLEKILLLRPKSYEMKRQEYRDSLTLPAGNRMGLVAQDVESVMPDLVREVVAPPRFDRGVRASPAKGQPIRFKSVNYLELIPVLVGAVQEQQEQIEALRKTIVRLESRR